MTRRLLPSVLIALAIGYLWFAIRIPLDPWSEGEALNSRTLPTVYAVLLIALVLPLVIKGVETSHAGTRWGVLALQCAAIVAFGFAIEWLGVWPALAAFLAASLLIMGETRASVLLPAPVVTAAAGWLIVEVLLGIYLDPGRLWT